MLCALLPARSHRRRWSILPPLHALQQEIRALSKARALLVPAIHLTKCLQARLDAWIQLCRITIRPSLEGDAQAALHPAWEDAASSLRTWLATPPGQSLLTELRWALLRPPAALARLRAMGPCGRFCLVGDAGTARGSCPPRLCPCLERSTTAHLA